MECRRWRCSGPAARGGHTASSGHAGTLCPLVHVMTVRSSPPGASAQVGNTRVGSQEPMSVFPMAGWLTGPIPVSVLGHVGGLGRVSGHG